MVPSFRLVITENDRIILENNYDMDLHNFVQSITNFQQYANETLTKMIQEHEDNSNTDNDEEDSDEEDNSNTENDSHTDDDISTRSKKRKK